MSKSKEVVTTLTLEERIEAMDWNAFRSFAKDSGIDIAGKKKEEITAELIRLNPTSEAVEYDGEGEEVEALTPQQKMERLIRCKVTCLNPIEISRGHKLITIGNMENGFNLPQVVKFNRVSHLYAPVVDFLRGSTFSTTEKEKDASGTVVGIRTIQAPSYNVTVLPPLTEDEIKEIADRQALQQAKEG